MIHYDVSARVSVGAENILLILSKEIVNAATEGDEMAKEQIKHELWYCFKQALLEYNG